MEDDHYRLPRTVVPIRYDLTIEPDLDTHTFRGEVAIRVEVVNPVREILLNSAALEIDAVEIEVSSGERSTPTIEHIAEDERIRLNVDAALPIGEATISLRYAGVIGDSLEGFYRAHFVDQTGAKRTIAVTQLEATNARRAFPCWDEPDRKAVFALTLVVDEGLTAIANAAEVSSEPTADGRRRVRFADTIGLSTYLVAWAVGPFEVTDPVDVDGVPLRVVHTPGKGHLTGFALEVGAFALRYLHEYYGVPYPGDKLDFIGLPDFAWGAMENLGAVTFRENLVVMDPEAVTQDERQRAVDVIGHEVAHMWFGDLVTMAWWDGIWLNEAFARFMELKVTDTFRPEWNRWLSFAIDDSTSREASMEVDALAATRPVEFDVASPDEANEMFDALTYGKGAVVLRMLEQYVGEDVFRAGIASYLKRHAYGNATTDDLWAALGEASGEPVGEIMHEWIRTGGYPLVDTWATEDGIGLTQRPFRLLGEPGSGRWRIPVLYRTDDASGRLLLDAPAAIDGSGVVVNAGGHGFYRVRYETRLLDELVERLDDLESLERFCLVSDRWALVLAGDSSLDGYLELVQRYGSEPEPVIWDTIVGTLAEIDRVAPGDTLDSYRQWVARLLRPLLDRLGWSVEAGEADRDTRLRGTAIRGLGIVARDPDVIASARRLADRFLTDGSSVHPDVAGPSVSVMARSGDVADFDRFLGRYVDPPSPQEGVRARRALGQIPSAEAAARALDLVADRTIRRQDAPFVVATVVAQPDSGAAAWNALTQRWDAVLESVPVGIAGDAFSTLRFRSEPEVAASISSWMAEHPVPSATRKIAQQLEALDVRVELRSRNRDLLRRRFGGG